MENQTCCSKNENWTILEKVVDFLKKADKILTEMNTNTIVTLKKSLKRGVINIKKGDKCKVAAMDDFQVYIITGPNQGTWVTHDYIGKYVKSYRNGGKIIKKKDVTKFWHTRWMNKLAKLDIEKQRLEQIRIKKNITELRNKIICVKSNKNETELNNLFKQVLTLLNEF